MHGEVMIKANHWMVSENVIDMAHVPYVHKGTVGNHAAFVDIIIEHMPTAMNFSFPIESHHDEGQKASFKVDTMATMCLPSTSFIRFTFPGNFRMVTINSVVPIDEEHTCIRFCQMRNFLRNGLVDPLIQKCAFVCLRLSASQRGQLRTYLHASRLDRCTFELRVVCGMSLALRAGACATFLGRTKSFWSSCGPRMCRVRFP